MYEYAFIIKKGGLENKKIGKEETTDRDTKRHFRIDTIRKTAWTNFGEQSNSE